MNGNTVSIVIPALNEEETLGKLIDEIPGEDLERRGYRVEIVVVDNNSTDRTGEIAAGKGVQVIMQRAKGKGRAIRTAFDSVTSDFLFMLDADYTYPATYIPEMLEVLQQGYDVVIGSRLMGQRAEGAMSKMNLMGNHLLALLATTLYRTRIHDLCSGYWGLTRKAVDALELDATGFELEANLFIQVVKKGCKIAEVPIYYRTRMTPSRLNRIKDGLKIAWTLIRKRF